MIGLMRQAAEHKCKLLVFPELALATRWWMTDQLEIDSFFGRGMPREATRLLFDEAQRLGIGFYPGFAEIE
jgi:hypothetical protein